MDENEYNEIFGLTKDDGEPGGEPGTGDPAGAGEGSEPGKGGNTGGGTGNAPEGGASRDEPRTGGEGAAVTVGRGITPPDKPAGPTGPTGQPGPLGANGSDEALNYAIRSLGLVDPYTRKPITTKAQYDAYNERAVRERRQRILDRSGMTEEELDEFIATLPEVAKAREDSRRAEDFIRREREREARARVDAEVAKIAAMDPSVKSIADLTTGENYDKLLGYVKRGYELSDAWTLANFDRLREMDRASARQAAHNSQEGRAGMERSRQRGQGDNSVPVPKEEKELFQALNPGASDEEIKIFYNDYLNGRK